MNEEPGGSRDRRRRPGPRRAGLLAVALAGVALLAVGCGGGGTPAAAGSKAYRKALVFAQCMRSHGAPTFPDPTSQGTFIASRFDINSPQDSSALQACSNLLPPGAIQVPVAQQREILSQSLAFAACMRSHGIANFPDPTVQDGAVGFSFGPDVDSRSPQFQSAQQACRRLGPGGGP